LKRTSQSEALISIDTNYSGIDNVDLFRSPHVAMCTLADLEALVSRATALRPAHKHSGSVCQLIPGSTAVSGLSRFVTIGDAVSVDAGDRELLGEVASVDAATINVTLLEPAANVRLGARVTSLNGPFTISPDHTWQGRVVNSLGAPIDSGGPLKQGQHKLPLSRISPAPLSRETLKHAITTGVKVVDLFTPICAGQRLGIFAGSGVGKSTLLTMLSRSPSFDVTVLALVGERGREVRDFLDSTLTGGRTNCVTVVATADDSPTMRRMAPNAAMCVAEYFRDQGKQVLLIVDSITRYAHAMRELALAAKEPPVARGYPPSVFNALARLLERAGAGAAGAGTITAILAVLIDGDDHNDPIADAARGILDGHIVLDRAIATQGRFPAVDPLASISRLAAKIRTPLQAKFAAEMLGLIQRFEDTRDLRMIGGYRIGGDPDLDRAVALVPRIYEILKQSTNDRIGDDIFSFLSQQLTISPVVQN
jgi:flagellum-specific ATP synthase